MSLSTQARTGRATNRRVLAAAVTVALALAGCSSSKGTSQSTATAGGQTGTSTGSAKKCTAKVLLIAPFSGAQGAAGQAELAGAQAAVNDVNQSGGVVGCQIVLDKRDDGSDFTKDLPLLVAATASTHYDNVMDSDFASTATAPYINREGLLGVGGSSQFHFTEPSAPYPTIFDTVYLGPLVAITAIHYAASHGYHRIALMVDSTSVGQQDIQAINSYSQQVGVTISDTEQLSEDGVNFTPAILRARASDPQILFVDLYGTAAGHLREEIATSGWTIHTIGGPLEAATTYQGLVPESLLSGDLVVSSASMAYPPTPVRAAFIQKLQQQGVTISAFLQGYSLDYDAIILFAWAANQTNSLDAKVIAAKLHSSGNVPIPGLVEGQTTGYTPTSGEWNPQEGLAVMKLGYYINGQLPSLGFMSTPMTPEQLIQSAFNR